jgi:hypothetical protein
MCCIFGTFISQKAVIIPFRNLATSYEPKGNVFLVESDMLDVIFASERRLRMVRS